MDITDGDSTTLLMSKTTQSIVDTINPKDLSTIGADFGEVLGGFYFFQKYDAKSVKYPAESNTKLIDFIVDDVVFVSSKYQKGATPSVSAVAEKLQDNKSEFKKIDKGLIDIIENVGDKNVSSMYSYLIAAKVAKSKIYEKLNAMGLIDNNSKQKNNTPQLIAEFLKKKLNALKSEEKFIEYLRKEFWGYARSEPDANKAKQLINNPAKGIEGLIIYPMQSETVYILNNTKSITEGLTAIAKTLGVKQLYLDFKISKSDKNIIFKIKDFKDQSFKFALNTSANNYLNSNLAFSM